MIVQITVFRDLDHDIVIEQETEVDPNAGLLGLALGAKQRFVAPLDVPVQTPQGTMRVSVRCPLTGATSVTDAFARFKELVEANIRPIMDARLEKMRAEARRMSLGNVDLNR